MYRRTRSIVLRVGMCVGEFMALYVANVFRVSLLGGWDICSFVCLPMPMPLPLPMAVSVCAYVLCCPVRPFPFPFPNSHPFWDTFQPNITAMGAGAEISANVVFLWVVIILNFCFRLYFFYFLFLVSSFFFCILFHSPVFFCPAFCIWFWLWVPLYRHFALAFGFLFVFYFWEKKSHWFLVFN